jgi:hypothetical protein
MKTISCRLCATALQSAAHEALRVSYEIEARRFIFANLTAKLTIAPPLAFAGCRGRNCIT